ncbi:DUF3085 domain-containing protein [Cupriavidus basilensis]|uniref:DUF3085 domain-containing protein n=1 Tax=Cupriavidus sp. SK-3 TaxID=1470558 RepID=UPI0004A57711|nr:DUF3085 domain-containing protein [Cupriavidus sp. SK-3]KDP83476.1 hypothetical protein CF70_025300 [Cupriavidus sp. SK-3]
MPQITLSRAEVQSLVTFSEEVNTQRFFIAKDHGAYIGCSVGSAPSQKRLFFFKGCNPAVDKDFYENARRAFGGDDFGEHFPVADLVKMLAEPACMKVRVTVTRSNIRIDGLTG